MHDYPSVALFPRIIIMSPPSAPHLNSRSHANTNTLADVDLLQQALEFAAECEADIKPEDRKRMVKKILG